MSRAAPLKASRYLLSWLEVAFVFLAGLVSHRQLPLSRLNDGVMLGLSSQMFGAMVDGGQSHEIFFHQRFLLFAIECQSAQPAHTSEEL